MKISTLKNIIIVSLVFMSFISGYFLSELNKPIGFSDNINNDYNSVFIHYNQLNAQDEFSTAFLELKLELGENYSDEYVLNQLSDKYKTKVEIIEKMKLFIDNDQKQIKL